MFTGPNIVTDGLVLYLDAANTKSYVSGSTTWNDLSGNGNDGELINGPTFDPENNGSIVFDGVNDYITTPTSRNDTLNEDYTISIVVKINAFTSSDMRLLGSISGATSQLAAGWSDNVFRVWLQRSWNNTNFISSPNTIYHLTICHKNTDISVFIDGIFNSNIPNKTSYFDNLGLGNSYLLLYGSYFNGNIYQTSIYNRALSAEEVLQNYNATKTRFKA